MTDIRYEAFPDSRRVGKHNVGRRIPVVKVSDDRDQLRTRRQHGKMNAPPAISLSDVSAESFVGSDVSPLCKQVRSNSLRADCKAPTPWFEFCPDWLPRWLDPGSPETSLSVIVEITFRTNPSTQPQNMRWEAFWFKLHKVPRSLPEIASLTQQIVNLKGMIGIESNGG